MERIRWGVLSTASIAERHAVPAIQASTNGVVQAVASRTKDRAQQFADKFSIPHAYGSYEQLVESDEVDVIYIPLPNDMHLEWIVKATEAGKHVLCEKPLGLNAEEVLAVKEAAARSGRQVMEGIASNFHPIHNLVVQMVQEHAVGDVRFIRMSLGWSFAGNPHDYRWKKEHGGGGLLDIGGYCLFHSRMIAGTEPEWVVASASFDPDNDIDTNMAMMMQFPKDVVSLIDCGLLSAVRNGYEVIGSTGKIVVETPFGNGNPSRKATLFDTYGKVIREETLTANQFHVQMETVSACILEGKDFPISLDESFANIRVLDACMASARNNSTRVEL